MMKSKFWRIAAIVALAGAAMGCSQVDTGNVGVVSVWGQVKPDTVPAGVYETMTKTVTEVCGKELRAPIANLKPQTSDKITLADLDVDIYFQIDPTQAAKIMTKWSGDRTTIKTDAGETCDAIGMKYVERQAREVLLNVATRFGSSTIHTERTNIAAQTIKELQANLNAEAGKGMFTVLGANVVNLVTDPALEANIKAAANATFERQKEINQLEVTKLQADRKRVEAQGEADAIRIKAAAVSANGGAEYVQLQWIAKWNGAQPTTQLGGSAQPMFNVSK